MYILQKEVLSCSKPKYFKAATARQSESQRNSMDNCYFLIPSDDPWALLRQSFDVTSEDMSFDREQPMLNDLSEREDI